MSDPPLLFTSKITDGDTRLEVLGWIIDTEALTVTLPSRKRLREGLLCVWFLRQTHGCSARIVLCRVHVKKALRQVLVDPVGASVFGYVTGGRVVVDLRLQFGWRNSPGYWACWLPRMSKLTPALRFKAPLCPRKGPPPSCMLELPRRGGFRWCRSRVIVALSLVWAAMPGATSSCGTTSMMVFSSSCSGGLT